MGVPDANFQWYCGSDIILARNQAVRDLALPSACGQFIFFDEDVAPGPETDALLTAAGDMVGAMYMPMPPGCWSRSVEVHCGALRVSRGVFETVAPPWFMFRYAPDGRSHALCECGYFAAKAPAAGFSVVRAGRARHCRG